MVPEVLALVPVLFHTIAAIFQHHPGPVIAKTAAAKGAVTGILQTVVDDIGPWSAAIEQLIRAFAQFSSMPGAAAPPATAAPPAARPAVQE